MTEVPLYEYQCPNDGVFELVRKFSDPPLLVCPTCGAPVEKLLSAPAIQFKGTGWYITDYARKGSTDKGTTDKGGKDKGGSTETKSGDASSSKDTSSSSSASSTPSSSSTPAAGTGASSSGSDKK